MAHTDIQDPKIVTKSNYVLYLYHGKVMVDKKTGSTGFETAEGTRRSRKGCEKIAIDRDLTYDTSKNDRAGPFWDRALAEREGDKLVADLKKHIEGRNK